MQDKQSESMSKSGVNEQLESPFGMSEVKSFLPSLRWSCLYETL